MLNEDTRGSANFDEEAIAMFDKALQINPNNIEALWGKAKTLPDEEEPEKKGISRRKLLITGLTTTSGLLIAAGVSHIITEANLIRESIDLAEKQEYKEEALKKFDQAIQNAPNNSIAWYDKGRMLEDLGRHEEAIVAYDQAIRINPNDISALNSKGVSLEELGRSSEAVQAYEQEL